LVSDRNIKHARDSVRHLGECLLKPGQRTLSLPEHVGTCGTGSGESFGVRRALGNIVLLMRCS
jgi:hypothetical protein